jgi:hypothetical protein
MRKWEYSVHRLVFGPGFYTKGDQDLADQHVADWLNSLGADGWDIVKIESVTGGLRAIFKREISHE